MARSASKFVLDIEAQYTGNDLKQLQNDLNQLGRVDAFRQSKASLQGLLTEIAKAKTAAQNLKSAWQQSGSQDDRAAYEAAAAALNRLSQARDRQQKKLRESAIALKQEGLAARDAAQQYSKLSLAVQKGGHVGAARSLLGGLRSDVSLKQDIAGIENALNTLRHSGTASWNEIARAEEQARVKIQEIRRELSAGTPTGQARSLLGLPKHSEIAAEINRIKAAYKTIAADPLASGHEKAQAHMAMLRATEELQARTNGWGHALADAKGKVAALAGSFIAMKKAASLSISFESDMAGVRKTVDGSKEEIEALGNELRRMSTEIPVAAGELARIAAIGGQLGIARDEIAKFTEITSKMSVAFDMTADEAGDAIGKMKNVFQLTIPQVESLGDVINQLGNNTAAREKDIVNVMLRIGGTSKQFGIADKSAAALAATMLSLGRPAEVAGTSINAMLNKLQTARSQGKRFQEALEAIGMSAEGLAREVAASPQQALDHLLETLSKLEGQQRAEVLTGLFGQQFQDDVGVLVGSLQTYRDAMSQVADETKVAGAMNREFAAQSDTTANQLQLLANSFADIWRSVGDGLRGAANWAAEYLNPIVGYLADMARENQGLTTLVVTLGAIGLATKPLVYAISTLSLAGHAFKASLVGINAAAAASKIPVLTADIEAAALAAKGFTVSFGAIAALLAGVAVVGGTCWKMWREGNAAMKEAEERAAQTAQMQEHLRQKYSEISRETGVIVKSHQDLVRAVQAGQIHLDQATGKWVKGEADKRQATEESMQAVQRVTGEKLDAMKKQYQDYFDKIKDLQDQITGREKDLAAELREMGRSGMTDAEAWDDRKKEAEEYMQAAKRAAEEAKAAMAAGDTITGEAKWKEAISYADQAKQSYKSLNVEVKSGDTVLVSRTDALKRAMAGVEEAGRLGIDLLKEQQQEAGNLMDKLVGDSGFADLTTEMSAAEKLWLASWQKMGAAAEEAGKKAREAQKIWVNSKGFATNISASITDGMKAAALSKADADRVWEPVKKAGTQAVDTVGKELAAELKKPHETTITIYKRVVEKRQSGGLIGAARLARGGKLPGFGGGDRISALLEAGEYVIRKEAVAKFGAPLFDALNRLRLPDLSALLPIPAPIAAAGVGRTVNINLSLGGDTFQMQTDEHTAKKLERWYSLRSSNRVSRTAFRG